MDFLIYFSICLVMSVSAAAISIWRTDEVTLGGLILFVIGLVFAPVAFILLVANIIELNLSSEAVVLWRRK